MSKKKLVIWDLDNTIWNGVLSEDSNVTLRENIVSIIKTLDSRGILQSIVSKNNYEDAMQKLKEFDLAQYFLYPKINWNSKSTNIKSIVKSINIGMDAVAFVDDQKFEREEVSFHLHDITCIDAIDINTLLDRDDMNPTYITEDSKIRRQLYQNDIIRNEQEEKFEGTAQEFLESLQMVLTIEKAQESDLQRAEELTVRTHQLNSTGYIYSYEELKNFISNKNYDLMVVDLKDKYGYYGKIGVILVEKTESVWTLKLLLTSCRVMNRGIGTVLLGLLVNRAQEHNVSLKAEFVPTDRNRIMSITYSMIGFQKEKEDKQKQTLKYMRNQKVPLPSYIKIIEK